MHNTRRRHTVRSIAAIAAMTALAAGLAACSADTPDEPSDSSVIDEEARALLPEEILENGQITVGATAQFPPFAYLLPGSSELVGYEPDIVNEIAARLGLDVQYETFEFQGLIPAIQSGRIQVAAAGLTDTAEREEVAIFVNDLIGRNGALIPADREGEYERFNDFCGETVAVVTGSVSVTILETQNESCADEGLPPMEKLELPDNAATLLAVDSGRADAALQTWPGAGYQIQQNPRFAGIVINEGMNARFTNGLAIDRNLPELADAFAAALQGMLDDGTYAEILEANGVDLETNGIPEVHLNWTTNGFFD